MILGGSNAAEELHRKFHEEAKQRLEMRKTNELLNQKFDKNN